MAGDPDNAGGSAPAWHPGGPAVTALEWWRDSVPGAVGGLETSRGRVRAGGGQLHGIVGNQP